MNTEYPIQIIHGGERLFIHPIAVDLDYHKNRIHFFYSPSGLPPYHDEQVLNDHSMWYQTFSVRQLIWIAIRRFVVSVKRCLDNRNHNIWSNIQWLFKPGIFLLQWCSSVPFIASEVYGGWFSADGQMCVVEKDDECLSYTGYLIPSQRWLSEQVERWLTAGYKSYKGESRYDMLWGLKLHLDERHQFTEWRDQMQERELEVMYLCSLDT